MFKIRSYELYTFYDAGAEPKHGYGVTPYTQPLHRWLIGQAYHWYDSTITRLPGFHWVDKIHEWWHIRVRHEDPADFLPLPVLQDINCFHLGRKGRQELRGLTISAEDYKKLGGHHLWREDNEDAEGPDGGPVQEVRGSDPAAPTP